MKQKKIFTPTKDAESWRDLLADKDKHWKIGYSAMSTALSWEGSESIPKEVYNVISENPDFKDLELLLVLPEYKVELPGGKRPSQNDVLAVFSTKKSLSVMTVEGKAKEDFDKTIIKWKEKTSDVGVKERLGFILEKIGIKDENIDSLRYQLFHRLASAVIVAEKFHAKNALMIIQSFNDNDKENHFDDYDNFIRLYHDSPIEKSKLYKLVELNGINVFSAWIYSEFGG